MLDAHSIRACGAAAWAWTRESAEDITYQESLRSRVATPIMHAAATLLGDVDVTALSWRWVVGVWIALELVFFAVIMVHLVPRMNRLEAPAKV